jgi:replicative DNA helicase
MIESISHQGVAGPNLKKKVGSPPTAGDRLPPHSPEAEAGVLGCVLLEPSTCLDELREAGGQPEWMYDLRHQHILLAMFGMFDANVGIDLITLQQRLKEADLLEQVGGILYLSRLQDAVPSAANLNYYTAIVREKWLMRQAITLGTEMVGRIYDFEGEVGPLISEVTNDFNKLEILALGDGRNRSEWRIGPLLSQRVIPKLEAHYTRGRAQMSGLVTTGLEYLDKIFCGWGGDNGNFHVVAARPNVGKTSLITGFALHAALDFEYVDPVAPDKAKELHEAEKTVFESNGQMFVKLKGVPVGISSLEMSAESLGFKMLFQRAKADLQRWRTGFATDADFPPLITAMEGMVKADNILIDDTPRETIASIKSKWRRWHRQHGVRFFLLDYIQLIKGERGRFRPDRVQEMEDICAELQALGKELNCPMCILAQLNRDYEKEPTRLPRLSDLKNCGAIEQDADSVTILYKPSLKKPGSSEDSPDGEFFKECMTDKFGEGWRKMDGRPERINALVEKNKHGPKGDAQLLFLKSSTLFVDYNVWLKENGYKRPAAGESGKYKQTKIDDEDVPPRRG